MQLVATLDPTEAAFPVARTRKYMLISRKGKKLQLLVRAYFFQYLRVLIFSNKHMINQWVPYSKQVNFFHRVYIEVVLLVSAEDESGSSHHTERFHCVYVAIWHYIFHGPLAPNALRGRVRGQL